MAMVETLTHSFERIKIAPAASVESPKRQAVYSGVAGFLNLQYKLNLFEEVIYRRRGIFITHDTYDHFYLSFDDDTAARSFLGDMLAVASASDSVIRVSELQLEEMNFQWDEKSRPMNSQFAAVKRPFIMATKTIYSFSAPWDIVRTVYYIAISQSLLAKLSAEAICRTSLNGLIEAQFSPIVEDLPDIRLPEISVEHEVLEALKSADLKDAQTNPPSEYPSIVFSRKVMDQDANVWIVRALVEHLIGIVKVGRRERPDTFLNLSEIHVPRFLPRQSLDNIAQTMGYAFAIVGKPPSFGTYNMQSFLVRLPVDIVREHVSTKDQLNVFSAQLQFLQSLTDGGVVEPDSEGLRD